MNTFYFSLIIFYVSFCLSSWQLRICRVVWVNDYTYSPGTGKYSVEIYLPPLIHLFGCFSHQLLPWHKRSERVCHLGTNDDTRRPKAVCYRYSGNLWRIFVYLEIGRTRELKVVRARIYGRCNQLRVLLRNNVLTIKLRRSVLLRDVHCTSIFVRKIYSIILYARHRKKDIYLAI